MDNERFPEYKDCQEHCFGGDHHKCPHYNNDCGYMETSKHVFERGQLVDLIGEMLINNSDILDPIEEYMLDEVSVNSKGREVYDTNKTTELKVTFKGGTFFIKISETPTAEVLNRVLSATFYKDE